MKRTYRLRPGIHNMGDVSIEHGSLDNDVTVYRSPELAGHYDQLIHIEAPTDALRTGESAHGGFKPEARWLVYRTDNERSVPEWADLDAVAEIEGYSGDLLHLFTSTIDADRAQAWLAVAEYYGWYELDSCPLVLSYAEAVRYIRCHIVTYAKERVA